MRLQAIKTPIFFEHFVHYFLSFLLWHFCDEGGGIIDRPMEKKRTRAQDASKGIMIIGVICFHSYLMIFDNPPDALTKFNIIMALIPFLLSTFFFYTGYNYVPNGKSFKENVLKRAKQLLIPLVVAFVISAICMSTMELIYDHSDIGTSFQTIGNSIIYGLLSEPFALILKFPQNGTTYFSLVLSLCLLWFLYCLFIYSVFFYLLVNFTNKRLENLLSVVAVLLAGSFCLGEYVGVYLPYSVECYPVVVAIMLTAAYLRKSHFLNRRILSKRDSVHHALNMIIAEGIIVGVCLACHYHFGANLTGSLAGGLFDFSLRGFDVFIIFGFSIIGTYFIHTLCRLLKHIPFVGAALQWIGNHSAIFYLFHPIPIVFASIVFFQKRIIWGIGQACLYVAFATFIMVLFGLLIDLIIKKKDIKRPLTEELNNSKDPEDNI